MKRNKITGIFFAVGLGFISILSITGQDKANKYDLFNLGENNKLEVFNRQVTTFTENKKRGVRFSKKENDGIAWLNGIIFSDGSVEVDIRGKDILQQSFVGIAFHGVDNKTFDAVYFRPFNFRSDDPVRKIHAVQYIAQPDYTWQILREKFNGKYEKAINTPPEGNEWFHVKITVKYPLVTVYVNGKQVPDLTIEKLNDRKSGKIGLWVGNNSDGDFANLQIWHEK
jgi:hypothetical protein